MKWNTTDIKYSTVYKYFKFWRLHCGGQKMKDLKKLTVCDDIFYGDTDIWKCVDKAKYEWCSINIHDV